MNLFFVFECLLLSGCYLGSKSLRNSWVELPWANRQCLEGPQHSPGPAFLDKRPFSAYRYVCVPCHLQPVISALRFISYFIGRFSFHRHWYFNIYLMIYLIFNDYPLGGGDYMVMIHFQFTRHTVLNTFQITILPLKILPRVCLQMGRNQNWTQPISVSIIIMTSIIKKPYLGYEIY